MGSERGSDVGERPVLALGGGGGAEAAAELVRGLQAAIDMADADAFNRQFARDVLWGTPFGGLVGGYDEIHAIHSAMFSAARGREDAGSRYEIEEARLVAEDVAIAYVRRLSLGKHEKHGEHGEAGEPQPGQPGGFDELALFVLVRRDGAWWLAAGLHTPDRRDLYR